jgi:radical SAM superfamily enzyme YgiQ (UPF0313 family)
VKILLVAPSKDSAETRIADPMVRFPQVALLYVASLTPPEHEVTVIEEELERLDFDRDCDLVGITSMTATAQRAYDIADEFRSRGRKVVLGGIHPTIRPQEAGAHADAVVVGEAEPVWQSVLEDAAAGRLQPTYTSTPDWDLDAHPLPRRELKATRSVMGIEPVVASRGCPFSCEFCCVHSIFGRKVRHVSVPRVVEDIRRSGATNVMFLDDNIVGDQRYATELFRAISPLGIKWVGQASISFVKNRELLDLAVSSGCSGLFVGLETVSEVTMALHRKTMGDQASTLAAIHQLMDRGVYFHASMVFGFDDDGPSVFDETLEFLARSRIPSVTFNILTPYPGTALYDRLKAEGRIITEDWQYYDHCTPVYVPKRMRPEELAEGYLRVKDSFYSWGRILRRLPATASHPLIFFLANYGLRKGNRAEQVALRQRTSMLAEVARRRPVFAPMG